MTRTRLWRLLAVTVAGLVVAAALLVTTLRIAIAYLPEHVGPLHAWVEQQTHMRFEYDRLDARLRWYGPELVLGGVRVLEEDGSQTIFTVREGSVGLDVWNFFRTGQLVAGRVRLDRPKVTLVRLPDGRIRLFGLSERPTNRPPFDFDRLPAGRVVIENATVAYRDLDSQRAPLELRDLDAVLRRSRRSVVLEGTARLPEALGSAIQFEASLKGSLDEREQLTARVDVRAESLRLAGLDEFVPARFARLRSGRGPVRAVIAVEQGQLTRVRLDCDLHDVALTLPVRAAPPVQVVQVTQPRLELAPGAFMSHATVTKNTLERPAATRRAARYETLAGRVRVRRDGPTWTWRVDDLHARTGVTRAGEPTQISGRWWGAPVSRFGLALEVERADLAQLWPLVLAFAPASFDRWAGLEPVGRINSLRVESTRERAGIAPQFSATADVAGLGVAARGTGPGVYGISGTLVGNDAQGRVVLRARDATFDWPSRFTAPIRVLRADADLTWRRDGAGWVVATRGARIEHEHGRARANAEFAFGEPGASPVLELDAKVDHADIASVPLFVPYGRLRERTIAWLSRAFIGGEIVDGQVSYRGPVRKFPFRHGEGDFTAVAQTRNVTIDYYPGFAPVTKAVGKVTFHNESIHADIASAEIAGLALARTTFDLSDYHAPVLTVDAHGAGDLQRALAYVKASPLGPRIGDVFMGLGGNGPARYEVKLVLPTLSDEVRAQLDEPVPDRDYFVRATLDGANVSLPALRAPVLRASGTFELHNDDITIPGIRGTLLDGPFELTASPGRRTSEVTAAIDLSAQGRVAGTRLPAFIGLPSTVRMAGTADWELRGRVERHGVGEWPLHFDVASNLVGLEVDAPQPFAKAPPETRATRVRIDLPGPDTHDITVESGTARIALRFADRNRQWQFERGTARFDGVPATLTSQPGLLVTGAWPQFDLGEWLALGDTAAPTAANGGPQLKDWLGPIDVHLDRATVFGFEFADIDAKLRGEPDAWRVDVKGPGADGRVSVPYDLSRGSPIVLDMERLRLRSVAATPATAETQTDPRKLPALSVKADDFAWEQRQFGRLEAEISRDPRGLKFDSLHAKAPAFEIRGSGGWFVEPAGTRTQLLAEFESTDLSAATAALGYRDVVEAKQARIKGDLWWPGGPSGEAVKKINGTLQLALEDGQLREIKPGAGRMLGLLSVAQLPRRLALDFRDVTDEGLAFNSVTGTFDIRSGNAYTEDLLLKGSVVDIGIAGRTGLGAEDYDQTVVVSGNTSGPLAVAGVLAAGPVIGAGVLVLSQLFKDQLQGLTRVYYHVGGPWSAPVVERVAAPPVSGAVSARADGNETGKAP